MEREHCLRRLEHIADWNQLKTLSLEKLIEKQAILRYTLITAHRAQTLVSIKLRKNRS